MIRLRKILSTVFGILVCIAITQLFNVCRAIDITELRNELLTGNFKHKIYITRRAVFSNESIWCQIDDAVNGEDIEELSDYKYDSIRNQCTQNLLKQYGENVAASLSLYFISESSDSGIWVISEKYERPEDVANKYWYDREGNFQQLRCNTHIYSNLLDFSYYLFFSDLIPYFKDHTFEIY